MRPRPTEKGDRHASFMRPRGGSPSVAVTETDAYGAPEGVGLYSHFTTDSRSPIDRNAKSMEKSAFPLDSKKKIWYSCGVN